MYDENPGRVQAGAPPRPARGTGNGRAASTVTAKKTVLLPVLVLVLLVLVLVLVQVLVLALVLASVLALVLQGGMLKNQGT